MIFMRTRHLKVCMNNAFVFSISLLLYHTEATGFSRTIVWSAPPDIEKNIHQQVTLVLS